MECDKCGKILDQSKEKQFCTGCGAAIVTKKEKQARKNVRERASDPSRPVQLLTIESEIRARAMYAGAFFGFFFIIVLLTILGSSRLVSFVAALLLSPVAGVVFMAVIARSAPGMKSSFNDSTSVLPVSARMKERVEKLSSMLPFIGALPKDDDPRR